MKKLVFYLFEHYPLVEVILRRVYYKFGWIKKFVKKPSNKKQIVTKNSQLFNALIEEVKAFGVGRGDILIVHSSMDGLEKADATPEMFIDALLNIIGEEGTLVFPAFPMEKKMVTVKSINQQDNELLFYDPKKTPSWTGLIPNIFCRYPGVIRSEFPNNSLAAKGKHSIAMMQDNLKGDLPHGKNSAWAYCVSHHAKILFLGLPAYHSNTVIHVAEDLMDDSWPIKGWYESKKYIVATSEGNELVTTRERKLFWARYIAEHYISHILKANSLLIETYMQEVCLGFISDSKKLVDYLVEQANIGKIVYRIPRKYWK